MRIINYILSSSYIIIYCFYFIKEYYSYKRFLKGLITVIKNYKYKLIFLMLLYIIPYIFTKYISFLILLYIFYIFNLFLLPKIRFKLHFKGYRLIIISILLNLLTIILDYRLSLFFMLINPILIVIFSNFLLSPFEKINNKRYINKAKKKILKINPIIIGITGSFSKTTFKTYLHHFLKDKYVVYKSEGNINTLMGLTKWINNSLNSLCEILILEIGIDEYHGIRKFKKLFSLDIGVITSVGKMHLSTFKTYERIIESKCEIDYLLKDKGFLFINDYYDELKQYNYRHSTYFYSNKTIDKKLNTFQNTALNGVFQIAQFLNVEKNNFENLLKTLPNIPKRFEIKENNEMTVINDSYNINYYGVLESIKYMNKLSGVKIVITGGLIELGKHFYSENYNLGKEMKVINYLFLISNNENHPLLKGYEEVSEKKGFVVSTFDEAKQKIRDINDKKIILITAAKSDFFIE